MGWAMLGVAAFSAAVEIYQGYASVQNSKFSIKSAIEDLEREKERLSQEHSHYEEVYQYNVQKANAELEDANRQLDNQISDLTDNRGRNLGQNAYELVAQDTLDSLSLASLQVQNAQEEGKALNAISASGTRLVGSGANPLRNQRVINSLEEQEATGTYALNKFKAYSQAQDTFAKYSQDISGKELEKVAAANATARVLEGYALDRKQKQDEYDLSMQYIDSDIRSLRKLKSKLSTPFTWEWLGGFAGSTASAASSVGNAYLNYKMYTNSQAAQANA